MIISLIETIRIALKSMAANKLRTALTVLGVVIGIASVIIVYSAGAGIHSLIVGEIESFGGSDMFETEIKIPSSKKGGSSETQNAAAIVQGVQITTLTLKDMEDIKKIPNVKNGYAGIIDQEQISYQSELKRSLVLGVTSSYIEMDKSEIGYGRFFTEAEDKSLLEVAVLGNKLKESLFGDSDPIGRFIKIRKKKFKVVGVLKERGAVMQFDFDNMAYVPLRTLQKKVMGIDHVQYMMHQVYDVNTIDETVEQARYILRQNHNLPQPTESRSGWSDTGKDDFRTITMKESMSIIETVTGAITLLLLAIVAVSLLVGGVGIMNIMYVIVSERTPEIGLRKSLGADYNNIMLQFLFESIFITVIGGVIGIILGVLMSLFIAWGANFAGFNWKFSVPLKAFIVALGFSTFFGIIFGLYPARKAARMDPITALRKE